MFCEFPQLLLTALNVAHRQPLCTSSPSCNLSSTTATDDGLPCDSACCSAARALQFKLSCRM